MLDCLRDKQGITLSELVSSANMTRQSASRHIAVLEDAELVVTYWKGREKLHYLNPIPLAEISERWIDKFSASKTDAIINLKRALQESKQ